MLLSDQADGLAYVLCGEDVPQIVAKICGCEPELPVVHLAVFVDHLHFHSLLHQLSAVLEYFVFQVAPLLLYVLLPGLFLD